MINIYYVYVVVVECSVDLRCEECVNWSKEEILAHERFANH